MHYQKNKPLKDFSTFGIGGAARLFVEVTTIDEMKEALGYAYGEGLPFHILGKGSNSLFDDRGFCGLVIHNRITFCEENQGEIYVGGGFSFSLLGSKTARKGLTGLEFASGIPASVGGAIFMNAGANGHETCETLMEVTFIDERGGERTYQRDELTFTYRSSSFHTMRGAIAAARFSLATSAEAKRKQKEIIDYRMKTQPYTERSCGCIFRNPLGRGAGQLIEECGLKGAAVGGAKVSTLHANFIINDEGASAKDVQELARRIQEEVKQKSGTQLELELRSVPFCYE